MNENDQVVASRTAFLTCIALCLLFRPPSGRPYYFDARFRRPLHWKACKFMFSNEDRVP